MKNYQYEITSYELIYWPGKKGYYDSDMEVEIEATLGNSGRFLKIQFYPETINDLPKNRYVNGIIYISMRSALLDAFLKSLDNGVAGFDYNIDEGKGKIGFNKSSGNNS